MRGLAVVVVASEDDDAPQHPGTAAVSPPPGGNKPNCRKKNAPGSPIGGCNTHSASGVGPGKLPNHHCRPPASRNEKLSWRGDASETDDVEPLQKIAAGTSKEATAHPPHFNSEIRDTLKYADKLHLENPKGGQLLSERKLASSETDFGLGIDGRLAFAQATVAGKVNSTPKYAVVERAFLYSVWNEACNYSRAPIAAKFSKMSWRVLGFFKYILFPVLEKLKYLKKVSNTVPHKAGLSAICKWLFHSRPPHSGRVISITMEPIEGLRPGATFWSEFSTSKKGGPLSASARIGAYYVYPREQCGTDWARFLAVCVGIWGRGVWHQHCRRKDTRLCKNGRLKVPNGESRSRFGSWVGMPDLRKRSSGRGGGLNILCGWMYHTAVLFLLLLSLCGTTSVVALEEINNGNIKSVARKWYSNNPSAEVIAMYGHISVWDTSRVTDMNRCKLHFLYCVV